MKPLDPPSASSVSGPPPTSAAPPRASHATIVLVLALLLGIQPVTTDLYLPALPALASGLQASMAGTQLTLSALLLAFGIGQLLLGPAADRYGRRPVLLWGLGAYAVAAIGGTLAADISTLVGWRVLQGVGMAAAVVCARAMVRDLFEPREGAHAMTRALSGLGLIALTSPVLGGLVAAGLGWRGALACTAAFGAATLGFIAWAMPETVRQSNRAALHLRPMLQTWGRILRHPTFRAWTLLVACTYGGIFTLLAGSSFVFIEVLGSSRAAYGLYLGACSLAYLAGTLWCPRWLRRHGLAGSVRRAAWFTLAGGTACAALALAGVRSPWAIVLPQFLFSFAHGIHQPCGQSAVVGPFPQHAGAASALAGFVLAAVAFLIGGWLGLTMDGSVYPLTLTIGAMSWLTAAVAWTLVQRHGEVRAEAR